MSLSSSSRCTADVSAVIPVPSDVSVDTLGKLVAVAGENGFVAVADLGSSATVAASFQAHAGVIVRVAWAHHRFGRVLLTASESGEFAIWSATGGGGDRGEPMSFKKSYSGAQQRQLNGVSWAPHEYGLMFALAWGDGQVVILCARDAEMSQWDQQQFMAHGGGCHAVSWSPAAAPGTLLQMPLGVPQAGASANQQQQAQQQQQVTMPSPRLVTCGPERSIRVWRYIAQDRHWLQEQELAELPPSVLLVRDVAWSPNPGLPFGYIVAGTDDGHVGVWRQDGCDGRWNFTAINRNFESPVCRVSWSAAGSLVTVNCADGGSTVWKEDPSGEWVCAFGKGPSTSPSPPPR